MRVTDGMLRSTALQHAQTAMRRMVAAQMQAASGKRVNKVSDDAVAAEIVLRVEEERRQIEQYTRNMIAARHRQTAEEDVLNELASLIEEARQIGLTEGSSTRSASTRASAQNIVDQILTQVIALGNTRVGNEYIFGGRQITGPAFDAAGNYLGDSDEWTVQIDRNFRIVPNRNGETIFVNTGVIQGLKNLSTALGANDQTGILAATETLRYSFNEIQFLLSDTGARARMLDATETLHEGSEIRRMMRVSDLVDVDLAKALTELASTQHAVTAALIAIRKGLEVDLTTILA